MSQPGPRPVGLRDEAAAREGGEVISRQAYIGIYGTAFFSLSMVPMTAILVPLWMVSLGASPLWIGIAIGARSLPPLLLSIHGGALMDRLGTRRVTLVVALLAVAVFPAYPLMPWIAAIILLQALFGLAQGLCWVGAQTFYGRLLTGRQGQAGKLTLFCSAGSFVGPLALGPVIEFGGAHLGFGFMCLWAAAMALVTLLVPRTLDPGSGGSQVRWRDLVPRVSDYRAALGLCAITVVMVVMIFTFIRIGVASMQTSFYVVYLDEIRMGESLIGVLLATANLVGTVTPLAARWLARRITPMGLLVTATFGTIIFMSITPMFTGFFALICLAALYGTMVGVGFPMLLTLLSRSVSQGDQGMSVGLRTSFNRMASLVVPVTMGAIAEIFSVATSFAVVGIILALATTATAFWVWRREGGLS